MDINYIKELTIAKNAAVEAGNFLKKNKNNINITISSTNRDIKASGRYRCRKNYKRSY